MNKQIATISLLFLIVLTGCKKPKQPSEPQIADAASSDVTELRNALKQS
jgi:hypothetical protein